MLAMMRYVDEEYLGEFAKQGPTASMTQWRVDCWTAGVSTATVELRTIRRVERHGHLEVWGPT